MKIFSILLVPSLLLAAAALAQNDIPAVQNISSSRQSELSNLLIQDCGSCHGLKLKGGLGPPLLPDALSAQSADMIRQTILDGRPGTAMPPWRALLSPAEAQWIANQLLQGPEL